MLKKENFHQTQMNGYKVSTVFIYFSAFDFKTELPLLFLDESKKPEFNLENSISLPKKEVAILSQYITTLIKNHYEKNEKACGLINFDEKVKCK